MMSDSAIKSRALLFVVIAMSLLAILEFMSGPFFVPQAARRAVSQSLSDLSHGIDPADDPRLEDFVETIERPLFNPTRRPLPKGAEAGPKTVKTPLELVGLVLSPGGRIVLLRRSTSDEVMRGLEGETVGGWKIVSIGTTDVELSSGGDRTKLTINETKRTAREQPRVAKRSNKKPAAQEPEPKVVEE